MNARPARFRVFCSSISIILLAITGCAEVTSASPGNDELVGAIAVMMETAVHGSVEATVAAHLAITPTVLPAMGGAPPSPQLLPVMTPTPGCRLSLTTRQNTVVREGPGQTYREIGQLAPEQTAEVIGRDAFYAWWVIVVEGRSVWVSGQVVTLSDCAGYPAEVTPPPHSGVRFRSMRMAS